MAGWLERPWLDEIIGSWNHSGLVLIGSAFQHHRAPLASVPESAQGRVPRGEAEHHLQPGLRQRGDRRPAAVAVAPSGHRRARRRLQVESQARHH